MTTTKQDASQDVIKAAVLGRMKVKPEVREQALDEFERSGMSGRAFAKHHGIKEQTFASWVQKRRRKRGDYENEEILSKLRLPKQAATLNGPPKPSSKSTALSLIEVALPSADNDVQTEPCAEALEVVQHHAEQRFASTVGVNWACSRPCLRRRGHAELHVSRQSLGVS